MLPKANLITELPRADRAPRKLETAFGCPRDFLGNRFVYACISPRAKGLSIGVNMNPDRYCNFDCAYCEVNRCLPPVEKRLDVDVMAVELQSSLAMVRSGAIRDFSFFSAVPPELLQLRHVTLSGDGEPTLCPNFVEAVESVMHVRACNREAFFKVVLITNATGLNLPAVQEGLKYFTRTDEIWAKLEAGTQQYMNLVNRPNVPLEQVLDNILLVARQRAVVIQSLFPLVNGQEPSSDEIEAYVQRLSDLKQQGAQISMVQIYSATRPTTHSICGHLPLRTLSRIAQRVKDATGMKVEVF
jgi:wyosine [tRNA(Phe)-imidazoG37] synthetase (radical SAM superfamily)